MRGNFFEIASPVSRAGARSQDTPQTCTCAEDYAYHVGSWSCRILFCLLRVADEFRVQNLTANGQKT